ncbi:MAG: DUF4846 domain-containing protein, partial [Desulfobacterales bacterium]|nr:DUF4846 domain-containing protein [Desulfobacterales bacterium]
MVLLRAFTFFFLILPLTANAALYPWRANINTEATVASRIEAPNGFERIEVEPGSFANWLRYLPLKRRDTPVYLYNGKKKLNQDAHFSVIDIDTGKRDLQQCADAVMRLRAEYLYSKKDFHAIHFNFTSGHIASFTKWAEGFRPVVTGNSVSSIKKASANSSYSNFRKYLDTVFTYAGSYSLSKELESVSNTEHVKIGDVFIKGGFPGHAVIVIDMAYNKNTGKKVFLLAQSYIPAQDIHILKNPTDKTLSPWYDVDFGPILYTPEWTFCRQEL